MRIYNKGAGRCEPFVLHLVRTHGQAVVLDSELVTATTTASSAYSQSETPEPAPAPSATRAPRFEVKTHARCARFKNTYFTFDAGGSAWAFFLAKDGSLLMQFSPL